MREETSGASLEPNCGWNLQGHLFSSPPVPEKQRRLNCTQTKLQLRGQAVALIKLADRHWIRDGFGFFPSSKNMRIEALEIVLNSF